MADFAMQKLNCSSFNLDTFVGGTQLGGIESCSQPIQYSVLSVLHCNSAKENDIFNQSVATQETNVSPDIIGRRHWSYVPEEVQLEVDGINSQAPTEYQPLKESSSSSVFSSLQPVKNSSSEYLSKDLEQLWLTDLPAGTEEIGWSLDLVDIGDKATDTIHLPDIEIFNHELGGVTGCPSTPLCSPIPEEETYPNSLVAPAGPPNTAKRQGIRRGNQIEASLNKSKKRPLYEEGPFADKSQEKRRKDALRAKRNRDRNKERSSLLEEEKEARLRVEQELAESRRKCAALEKFVRENYGEQVLAVLYNSCDAEEIQRGR